MKSLFTVLAAAGLALSACSDAALLPVPVSSNLQQLENPADPEDEAINLLLHLLARSVADVVREPEMLALVLEDAERSGEVRLSELASRNETFAKMLDASLARHSREENGGDGLALADVEKRMFYRGTMYSPNLYIPNLHVASADRAPIVAIGASVSRSDQIAGWDLRSEEPRPVLVSREMAGRPGGAVIIVTNGSSQVSAPLPDDSRSAAISPAAAGPVQQASVTGQVFKWSQYQVNSGYHYEVKTLKNDLAYLVTLFNSSWGVYYDQNLFVGGVVFNVIDHIRKSESDNNTVFYSLKTFTGTVPALSISTYPKMFVTVFEYDWWASQQSVTCGPLQHKPRMKYAGEWYAANCNIVIPTQFPSVNSTYVLSSWKGSFTIKRTQ